MLELIMTRTTDIGEFLKQNQKYLNNSRIAISHEVFEKLWDTCLECKGKIDIKQPTATNDRRQGLYSFVYTRKNSDGVLEELKVAISYNGFKTKPAKRFFIQAVSSGDFRYRPSKSILADKLYIDLHHTLKEELYDGRSL